MVPELTGARYLEREPWSAHDFGDVTQVEVGTIINGKDVSVEVNGIIPFNGEIIETLVYDDVAHFRAINRRTQRERQA